MRRAIRFRTFPAIAPSFSRFFAGETDKRRCMKNTLSDCETEKGKERHLQIEMQCLQNYYEKLFFHIALLGCFVSGYFVISLPSFSVLDKNERDSKNINIDDELRIVTAISLLPFAVLYYGNFSNNYRNASCIMSWLIATELSFLHPKKINSNNTQKKIKEDDNNMISTRVNKP